MRKEYIQVFTATEKKEDAEKIAKALVEKRLVGFGYLEDPRVQRGIDWITLNALKVLKRFYS